MSRSLKKGPYINVKLEKKVLTETNLFLFTLLKTWLDISWVSLLQHVHSVVMLVTRKNNSRIL